MHKKMKDNADLIIIAGQVATCSPGNKPKRGSLMRDIGLIQPGAVAVKGDMILDVADPRGIEERYTCSSECIIEAPSSVLMPGLVDAHTHPVFAGSRIEEYILRAQGATYLEIHKKGGGILSTVRASRKAGNEELMRHLTANLDRMMLHGTTTCEGKSGYGLATDEELRQLKLLKEVQKTHQMELAVTFLGAHTLPEEHRESRKEYIEKIRSEMLPVIATENLAEFMDIFCEEGAFTLEESRELFIAAREYGMGLKIHAEQFSSSGSALVAAELGAISCDHLLHLSKGDIEKMRSLNTIAVFMPGTELFLNLREYGPCREAIDAGIAVAIGTDYNAGSCLSESMPMAMSLSVLQMMLEPEEAINAATVNAAHSLGRGERIGSIEKGKQADMILLDMGDYREWLYHFGVNVVSKVIKRGRIIFERGLLQGR